MSPLRPSAATRHKPFRWAIEGAVWAIVAVLFGRTWLVAGLLLPLEVASGSMAETLLGPHYRLKCAPCGGQFVCGADHPAASGVAVCPHCGWKDNSLAGQPVVPGDGVLIVRGAYWLRSPRRWEVVAFRPADNPRQLAVKRVVGLPSETVRIFQGDVYINGNIARKSLREQLAVAQLIYSAADEAPMPSGAKSFWHPESPDSRWVRDRWAYRHGADPESKSLDWLLFQWLQRGGDDPDEPVATRAVPVTDALAYNQLLPRGGPVPQPVTDLLYTFRLRATGRGRLELRATDGQRVFRFVWEITPHGSRCQVFDAQQPLPWPGGAKGLPEGRRLSMAVSLVDRQFLVAVDGEVLVAHPFDRGKPPACHTPFAIGVQSLEVEVSGLQVYRDVQYGGVFGGIAHWGVDQPVALGPGEFLVLGDNSAVSVDSRVWANPAVRTEQLVGRPLAVLFPLRPVRLGGLVIQVPAWNRMRYIR